MGIAGKVITKVIGAGALYLGIKDAHIVGIAGKNKNPKTQIAKNFPDLYLNSQRLETLDTLPVVTSQMKQKWFNWLLDDNIAPTIHAITGYFSGLTFGLVNNVIPLTLGAGALLIKNRVGAAACAVALGIGAVAKFVTSILSLGSYKKL